MSELTPLAFPVYQLDPMHPGLTKREYFALHLMAGYIAADGSLCGSKTNEGMQLDTPEVAASTAIKYADALIDALAKREP